MDNKLNALKFALAGGIWLGVCAFLITLCAITNIPGFRPFAELLVQFYGPYGYSVSLIGAIIGAIWGFVEGFVHIGFLGLIYNKLLK